MFLKALLQGDDQSCNNRRNAFPLKPEHLRRPDDSQENGDEKRYQCRLRLVDAPGDDHKRRSNDEETRSAIRITLYGHGKHLLCLFPLLGPRIAGFRFHLCRAGEIIPELLHDEEACNRRRFSGVFQDASFPETSRSSKRW